MHTQSNVYPKRSLSQRSTASTSSHTSQCSQKKQSRLSNPLSSKIFRSKSPAPIDIPNHQASMSQPQDIPRSNPETSYFPEQGFTSTSPTQMSPTMSSPQSPRGDFLKRASTPTRKSSDDYKRYSGTVNHYGRHSNDWLFGGFSVRETVRDGIEKLRKEG